jgi:predicted nucleic acid-binding Zn ribbon protein
MTNIKICQHCGKKFIPTVGSKGWFCSKSCASLVQHIQRRQKEQNQPKVYKSFCIQCKTGIFSNNKFCSRSCAATFNNKLKTPESRKKQADTLIRNKIKSGWVPKKKENPVPRKRVCIICNRIDYTNAHFQSDKCKFCNDSLTYRHECKFKFDLRKFPTEFNLKLLEEKGMFNPKTNPKGVSRDHMLSVEYGKKNQIDPKIISHPANCKLITQGENTKKQSKCSITYPELIERIKQWDIKYLKN